MPVQQLCNRQPHQPTFYKIERSNGRNNDKHNNDIDANSVLQRRMSEKENINNQNNERHFGTTEPNGYYYPSAFTKTK
eukprot:Pgem_evm1s4553